MQELLCIFFDYLLPSDLSMVDNKSRANVKQTKHPRSSSQFCGFTVHPISIKNNCRHYIYVRRHESKSISDLFPVNRTLFVLNLPVDTTDDHIQHYFGKQGSITSITFDDDENLLPNKVNDPIPSKNKKRKREQAPLTSKNDALRKIHHSGSSAHVVFSTLEGLENALLPPAVNSIWEEVQPTQPLGFQRYILNCALSRPDHHSLQQEVDSFMLKFKENEYQREREASAKRNTVDEDGFTLVTRRKKGRTTYDSTSFGVDSAKAPERRKKETINFFGSQERKKKIDELALLRKRFEEDKQKLEKLKQSRKFKPF